MKSAHALELAAALAVVVLGNACARAQVYDFITIAGLAGSAGSADGTKSDARFYFPRGLAVDSASNVYVVDCSNYTIRKLTLVGSNWVSSTIAGLAGHAGSTDGTNSDARFGGCIGVALDSGGSLYVADFGNYNIRKLSPVGTNWVSSTIAGLAGCGGYVDGTNSGARFNCPVGVALDSSGSVYVTDEFNDTIRKLTPWGTNWVSRTIAGLAGSHGSADGTNSEARFYWPHGITLDTNGNVYVSEVNNNTIREGVLLPVPPSPPVFQSVTQTNNNITFTWSAVIGRTYQLQCNSDLASSNWLTLGIPIVATNGTVSASDTNRLDAQRFYRLELLP